MSQVNFAKLPTEQINSKSRRIDRHSISQILSIINKEDQTVPQAVWKERKSIEKGVKLLVRALESKGRIFFIGAGTSGRLGVIEAAECPPTFNTPPSLVQAIMAGGKQSVFRSKEGAEDHGAEARRIIRKKVNAGDVVIGIAASGVTPFVKEGLSESKKKKAKTILVTCHPQAALSSAHVVIRVNTGPEVIAGSTRLKAGTATKLVLNSLTVASMIQVGKVYGNRMVDLQPRSKKLKARAVQLISSLGKVSLSHADILLKAANGNPKTAIVMALLKTDKKEALIRLKKARGHLHEAIR